MRVIIKRNYDEMCKEAAKIVLSVVKKNPNAILGLATGSTPIGLYQRLIEDHKLNKTSYQNIKTINLDEYKGLDFNNSNSYAYFMRHNLFNDLEIPFENTNIENGMASNDELECERYNKILENLIPDIQILGIGSNGHIAFNEPGTSFESVTHVVNLNESTIKDNSRLFSSIYEVPKQAFTMGLKNIMNSKKILILASGLSKAKAVYMAVEEEISENLPASILQKHDDCIMICDESAASLLTKKCFKNVNAYIENEGIIKTSITFTNTINSISPDAKGQEEISLPEGCIVLPGFIDEHTHGANNSDVMDGSVEALSNIANTLAKEGTTSFLATTMTMKQDDIVNAMKAIKEYKSINNTLGARLIGAHLEGPFISKKYKGAQNENYITNPSIELFDKLNKESSNSIKIVTLACENEGADELIRHLNNKNIVASIGHSYASNDDVTKAIENGASNITHTYNAQSPFNHREIGVVGSALLYDKLNCELIADTIHVSIPAMKLLVKCKPSNKITLITDAMRAKGLKDGISNLGGQEVIIKNNEARLKDGTLAGSLLKMNEAVYNMIYKVGVPFTKAVDFASINPAKNLHIDDKIGSIAIGKLADFVIVDKDLNVLYTFKEGKLIYKN